MREQGGINGQVVYQEGMELTNHGQRKRQNIRARQVAKRKCRLFMCSKTGSKVIDGTGGEGIRWGRKWSYIDWWTGIQWSYRWDSYVLPYGFCELNILPLTDLSYASPVHCLCHHMGGQRCHCLLYFACFPLPIWDCGSSAWPCFACVPEGVSLGLCARLRFGANLGHCRSSWHPAVPSRVTAAPDVP